MTVFNKPYLSGNELAYIGRSVASGKIAGDGEYTRKCHDFFEETYGIKKALLTTSCTHALEMAAILTGVGPGDEVIMPSYTFVSTANAFELRGARIVFADSGPDNPNMDVGALGALITERTRVIVPVHYAGIACDMDPIMELAARHGCWVVEDAAQAIEGYYKDRRLGTIGHLAAFSFHETKNIISGEGGMLAINEERFIGRAEIVREKGTDRSRFFRGEVDKYGWVDIGSSYLPSDIIAAFLYAQIENIEDIQQKRLSNWNRYFAALSSLAGEGELQLPVIPDFASNNAHMFYLVCRSLGERDRLIRYLKEHGIMSVFHYQSLHASAYYKDKADDRPLPESDRYSDCLVRLPMFYELPLEEVDRICGLIHGFFNRPNRYLPMEKNWRSVK